jgi:PAS domain S-box-containing protein
MIRSIEQHLGAWLGIVLAFLLTNAGLSYWNTCRIDENNQWVIHTHEVLGVIEEIQTTLLESESGVFRSLLAGDERYLEAYHQSVIRLPGLVGRLRRLTLDNRAQQVRIVRLERLITARLAILQGYDWLKKQGPLDDSTLGARLGQGWALMVELRAVIAEMKSEEARLLGRRDESSRISIWASIITIVLATLFAVALLVTVFGLFRRDLLQRRNSELALRRLNEQLEARVQERTTELSAANAALRNEIAEREQAVSELGFSEARLGTLVEAVRDYAIVMLDAEGHVMSWNSGAERIKGYTAEEILGAHVSCFYTADDRASGRPEHNLAVAAAEGCDEDEGWRVRKDGSRFWANVNITTVRDSNGSLRGFIKVTRDFTARRRAELELKDFAARLQRSNRELEEFASVASHDLQEPLRKIQAFGDRLVSRSAAALGDQGREDLGRIQAAAARMRRLIDDLLNFSRITAKAKPFTRTDLGQVVREVVTDLESRIQETGARVDVGNLPQVDADPTQMRQLFQNLIGNALKFHRADIPVVVEVRAEPTTATTTEAATCQISVRDNGIGFDEKYAERIFKVFERLHGRTDYEGTGIGLAVCRKIVERHGGTVTAHSIAGEGSTFLITIPLRHTHEEMMSRPDTQCQVC